MKLVSTPPKKTTKTIHTSKQDKDGNVDFIDLQNDLKEKYNFDFSKDYLDDEKLDYYFFEQNQEQYIKYYDKDYIEFYFTLVPNPIYSRFLQYQIESEDERVAIRERLSEFYGRKWQDGMSGGYGVNYDTVKDNWYITLYMTGFNPNIKANDVITKFKINN